MKVKSSASWRTLALAGMAAAYTCSADVTLPRIFSSNMVLQRQMAVPVWGSAAPGEAVSVSFAGRQATATADADGKWMVRLDAMEQGGPDTLTVVGRNTVALTNVVVGEVWLCSGQSNMAYPVGSVANASQEIARADYPLIREFAVDRKTSVVPLEDAPGTWRACSTSTVSAFTAAGYFFGRELHQRLNVPIGLINASWGGTKVEPWTPRSALERLPEVAGTLTNISPIDMERQQKDYKSQQALAGVRRQEVLAIEQDEDMLRAMAAPDRDAAGWKTMRLPGQWEKAGLPEFDGLVWFRKTVELPADWAGKDLVLRLGPVDEADATSFNGARVGGMGSYRDGLVQLWEQPRVYTVPGNLVKAGANVIAVRVIDSGFAGGIWGCKDEDMRLELAGATGGAVVSLAGDWLYQPGVQLAASPKSLLNNPNLPTVLYNAMIHPLVPYAVRGAIWYQGESNCGDGLLYRDKLAAMITGWRGVWGEGPFPFYYVQIAPYVYGGESDRLPKLWQAQKSVMELENTGMAVITDVTNVRDIHPRRKQEVGRRLALWALNRTYGFADVVPSGPIFRSMTVTNGAARLSFDYADGLQTADGETLAWFDVAAGTGAFVRATSARIEGNEVVVTAGGHSNITAVRYGWHEMAQPNLVNGAGLPASPFISNPELLQTTP